MNKELLENQWTQVREVIREKWGNLTEEDLKQIDGRYEPLISRLQQRYGYTREQAEDEVRRFTIDKPGKKQAYDNSTHYAGERSADHYSWIKTLLFIGIPLLLLGYFLANYNTTTTTQSPLVTPTTNERTILIQEGPVDVLTSQNIVSALTAQNFSVRDLANLNISTSNGVVTLSGTVTTPQQRDFVERIARNAPGVTQVNNQIQVK